MKIFKIFRSAAFVLVFGTPAFAASVDTGKRTDGVPGSEYSNFSKIEGDIQLAAHFGALLSSTGHDSSFMVGADADYRPYDLFGIRLTVDQGLQTPRGTLVALTPLVHTEISNLKPYALFGPGIALTNFRKDSNVRFAIVGGFGADVTVADHYGLGMFYVYSSLIDSPDFHQVGARLVYSF